LAAGIFPCPGHPQASHFPLPEFFHSFRGMKGDFTAFQKAKLLQFFQYLLMFRKAMFLLLGKNEFSVSRDFENTAAGFDQLGFHPRFFFDGFCQTGSLGVVVSIIAVFDRNALDHGVSSFKNRKAPEDNDRAQDSGVRIQKQMTRILPPGALRLAPYGF
jgi:hypothetical protein